MKIVFDGEKPSLAKRWCKCLASFEKGLAPFNTLLKKAEVVSIIGINKVIMGIR